MAEINKGPEPNQEVKAEKPPSLRERVAGKVIKLVNRVRGEPPRDGLADIADAPASDKDKVKVPGEEKQERERTLQLMEQANGLFPEDTRDYEDVVICVSEYGQPDGIPKKEYTNLGVRARAVISSGSDKVRFEEENRSENEKKVTLTRNYKDEKGIVSRDRVTFSKKDGDNNDVEISSVSTEKMAIQFDYKDYHDPMKPEGTRYGYFLKETGEHPNPADKLKVAESIVAAAARIKEEEQPSENRVLFSKDIFHTSGNYYSLFRSDSPDFLKGNYTTIKAEQRKPDLSKPNVVRHVSLSETSLDGIENAREEIIEVKGNTDRVDQESADAEARTIAAACGKAIKEFPGFTSMSLIAEFAREALNPGASEEYEDNFIRKGIVHPDKPFLENFKALIKTQVRNEKVWEERGGDDLFKGIESGTPTQSEK